MIKLNNINLIIKKKAILNNISFTLDNGEILGITGPSGSGKSSLLKVISGKLSATSGIIEINGKEIMQINKHNQSRLISCLFSSQEYNPEATVYDEILKGRIHLKKFLNPFSDIDRNSTYSLIDETGLAEKSYSRLKRASESIIKLTLLARTINSGSENIILDSPEHGLDPLQRLTIIRLLKKYTAKGDKSVLLASCELDFIIKVCDRIIILNEGCISDSGGNDIITEELMKKTFGIDTIIVKNIITGLPEIHIINNE